MRDAGAGGDYGSMQDLRRPENLGLQAMPRRFMLGVRRRKSGRSPHGSPLVPGLHR